MKLNPQDKFEVSREVLTILCGSLVDTLEFSVELPKKVKDELFAIRTYVEGNPDASMYVNSQEDGPYDAAQAEAILDEIILLSKKCVGMPL